MLPRITLLLLISLLPGCALLFPVEAGDDLADFHRIAPTQSSPAPNLTLYDLDGNPVRLYDRLGGQPVVLRLGSHSCPVYRYRRFSMADLERQYSDRVRFLIVYTQEAHPAGSNSPYRDGEWLTMINRVTGTRVAQTETLDQRIAQARSSSELLDLNAEILVDDVDNTFWEAFGRAPSPGFVIDRQRIIVLRQPWVEPDGIRDALEDLLNMP